MNYQSACSPQSTMQPANASGSMLVDGRCHDVDMWARNATRDAVRVKAWFPAALAGILLAACSHQQTNRIEVANKSLLFTGPITPDSADKFLGTLVSQPVERILISSGGGGVEPAIRMAGEIHRRGMDVEVIGPCFSSCANYIFPAGKHKTISGTGIVAWHGNMRHLLYLHETGAKLQTPEHLAEIQRLQPLEAAFFRSIGVDELICWVGKLPPYNARNMFFLSVEDMARFGVAHVAAHANYTATDTPAYRDWGRQDVQLVRIDWQHWLPPAVK